MYAVIETGGKQYRVEVGTELQVELIEGEPGQSITFDRVLLVGDGDATAIGQPVVADAAVEAEVVRRGRGEKVVVFKYRPKARTRTKKGHRQDHVVLRITDVKVNGRSAAEETRRAEEERQTERQRLQEAAARQAAADAELAAKLASRKSDTAPEEKPSRGARTGSGGSRRRTSGTGAAAQAGTDGGPAPTTGTTDAEPTDAEPTDAAAATESASEAASTAETQGASGQAATTDGGGTDDAAGTDDAVTDTDAATDTQPDEPAPKRGRESKDG